VFLDRDNTLIANDGDLGNPADVRLMPGVAEGLRRLKSAGFRLVVVTNQGGVARGRYSEADVDQVHARIAALVDEATGGTRVLDRFYYCPFHPEGSVADYRREHPWRKPSPGMLLQAATDLALDLDRGWMVGDQARDVLAGRAAGCRTVLLGADPTTAEAAKPDFLVDSFDAAVGTILGRRDDDHADSARRASERARNQVELKPRREGRGSRAAKGAARRTKQRRSGGAKAALEPLRRALIELVEEVRSDRTRHAEFGPVRGVAVAVQLAAVVIAVFALLELQDLAVFGRWMAGAMLAQLLVIALLLFDRR
jgi:D-glycero-D-manno-heptose 1,7-bisphosphate phosphatase